VQRANGERTRRTDADRRSLIVRRYRPIAEAVAVLVVTFPLAVGLHLSTLWLLTPLALITFTKRPYPAYGLTWERPGSVAFHAVVTLGIFPAYVLAHYAFAHWGQGKSFHFRWPPEFLELAADQVLAIALPEEFFFRGYFQTECDRVFGKPRRWLGADCGVGLPLTAAVFAVCHVVFGGLPRLIVFFPGLLYGWLRARTSTIAVPVVYHAISNLLMSIMVASFR
jgi:membrane protease YdiL (CAAX protease family)